ncbi:hypothetical protein CON64_10055 [Bacillus pseudomycoides]|nr:hypothetical protein CON64_10055 [Bacillus pseudomycoides]
MEKEQQHIIHRNHQDITFKYASELLRNDFLKALNIEAARITKVLANSIVTIQTIDLEVDFICQLEDGSILHLEFQTTHNKEDLDRFMKYDALLYDKYKQEIRTIVIFGAGIKKAKSGKRFGTISYELESVFLENKNGDEVVKHLMDKAENEHSLSSAELGELVLLPLMKTKGSRKERAKDALQIATYVKDTTEQTQALSMIFVMANKFLQERDLEELIGGIRMTKLYEIIKEETEQNVLAAAKMILKGMSVEEISQKLNLPVEQIQEWKKKLSN